MFIGQEEKVCCNNNIHTFPKGINDVHEVA